MKNKCFNDIHSNENFLLFRVFILLLSIVLLMSIIAHKPFIYYTIGSSICIIFMIIYLNKEYIAKLKQNKALIYLKRSEKYMANKDYDNAIANYSQVIKLSPYYADVKQKLEKAQRAKMAKQ